MKNGNHPIKSYLGNILGGIILVAIILFLCIFGFVDQSGHESRQNKQVVRNAGNSVKSIYKKNHSQFAQYVQQRTANDLRKAEPHLAQIGKVPAKLLNNTHRTSVKDISLNDSGNGSLVMNNHKYAFQLADVQFAPHVSRFYKRNKKAIQNAIQKEISKGHFSATRANGSQIYIYKNGHLLENQFLSSGIAYIPDLTHAKPIMKTCEHLAKSSKKGLWKAGNVVNGNSSNQAYSLASESGHKIAQLKGNKTATHTRQHHHGGRSASQSVNHWLSKH